MRTTVLLLIVLAAIGRPIAQPALNVALEAQVNRGDSRYSGSWVYVDDSGREYTLLGARTGTAVYDLDAENDVPEVAFIPGPVTRWREITVIGHHAYVVTDVDDTGHGLQVIDLSGLPESAALITTYDETFTKGHIIQRDILEPDLPFVYVCGTTSTQGVHILDISNPSQPAEIGLYQPGYYIHDCHVRGDLLFAAAFYHSTIDIVDISDKSTPTLLTQLPIPGGAIHSSSLTEDGRFLFITAEQDGLPARIWNVEDPDDPYEVATYTANPASLVHNPYIRGDFAFITHNTEGLRVVDLTDPEVPVEVGYYDTYAGPSGGFKGLWSACPYLPSGRIVGGNREDGLYVWSFNGQRAGRFYGEVVDSLTGAALYQAEVWFSGDVIPVDPLGQFRSGALPGNYSLTVSAPGYWPKEISIDLEAGDQQQLMIELSPAASSVQPRKETADIKVFPNPIRDYAVVEWPETLKADRLIVFDNQNQIRQNHDVRGKKSMVISGDKLAGGSYTLVLLNARGLVKAPCQLLILK